MKQPVQEYFTSFTPEVPGRRPLGQTINPFLAYTHLGTDFGMIGQNSSALQWQPGSVCAAPTADMWAGMWHSLEGQADEFDRTLDFTAAYPAFILPEFQPSVVGLEVRASGRGILKAEVKSHRQEVLWQESLPLACDDFVESCIMVRPSRLRQAKFLSWVAEPGGTITVDSIGMTIKRPRIPFDEYAFLASYVKFARNYDQASGFVRDRAHIRPGSFDNVATTGLFALATALAAERGFVSKTFAVETLRRVHGAVSRLGTASGVLPHFVKQTPDGPIIHPGTEFSTVDTALYYHGLLLAAAILHDVETRQKVATQIQSVDMASFIASNGYISHGCREDGVTRLPGVWRDWGGESVLVLMFARMAGVPKEKLKKENSGMPHDGSGFIVELQSLFYPGFNSRKPDLVTNQSWMDIRERMLLRQMAYVPNVWPMSRAREFQMFGLSAGEGLRGIGYVASGVDLPKQELLHPHYMLMAGGTVVDIPGHYRALRKMEENGLFPPWGMIENYAVATDEYLPMNSSLNAAFEALGAYHLLTRHRGIPNAVYEAAMREEFTKTAMELFYPAGERSAAGL